MIEKIIDKDYLLFCEKNFDKIDKKTCILDNYMYNN